MTTLLNTAKLITKALSAYDPDGLPLVQGFEKNASLDIKEHSATIVAEKIGPSVYVSIYLQGSEESSRWGYSHLLSSHITKYKAPIQKNCTPHTNLKILSINEVTLEGKKGYLVRIATKLEEKGNNQCRVAKEGIVEHFITQETVEAKIAEIKIRVKSFKDSIPKEDLNRDKYINELVEFGTSSDVTFAGGVDVVLLGANDEDCFKRYLGVKNSFCSEYDMKLYMDTKKFSRIISLYCYRKNKGIITKTDPMGNKFDVKKELTPPIEKCINELTPKNPDIGDTLMF